MKEFYAECYILKAYNVGEADKLFVLYSSQIGKFSARAKGIRKSNAKLKGVMQYFCLVSLRLIKGNKVDTIIGAQTKYIYNFPKNSIDATQCAYQLLEATAHIMPEAHANIEVYKLIKTSFLALDKQYSPELVSVYGLFQLLKQLGQAPQIHDTTITSQHYFDYDNGTIVSSRPNTHYGLISIPVIKLWRLLNEHHLTTLSKVNNINDELKESKRLLEKYYQYHFQLNFKSTVLLD